VVGGGVGAIAFCPSIRGLLHVCTNACAYACSCVRLCCSRVSFRRRRDASEAEGRRESQRSRAPIRFASTRHMGILKICQFVYGNNFRCEKARKVCRGSFRSRFKCVSTGGRKGKLGLVFWRQQTSLFNWALRHRSLEELLCLRVRSLDLWRSIRVATNVPP